LQSLVGKLDLLTRGLHLKLETDQSAKILAALEALDKDEEMTEEVAKEHLDAINEILTTENTELIGSIELPRPRAGGGGGGGRPSAQGPAPRPATADGGGAAAGGSAGPGVQSVSATGSGTAPVMSMGGGGQQPSNDNPFKQEDNSKRLQRLREQIRSSP
jgi:hypothetical protein